MTGQSLGIKVLVRGAGDLATGVGQRLYRAGFTVFMTEIPEPRAVRRTVTFSECIFQGDCTVEDIRAVRAGTAAEAAELVRKGLADIPVIVDTEGRAVADLGAPVLVDARMAKRRNLGTTRGDARVVVGVGPGFTAGQDVDAVVETARGHTLGRVIYRGCALAPTGQPGEVGGYTIERVLRAPVVGTFHALARLGDRVDAGQVVAEVLVPGSGVVHPVTARIGGVLRGLLRDGAPVREGQKAGDVDPRFDLSALHLISDKALAVGGGVLEAIMCLLWGRAPSEADWPREGGAVQS